jgi:MFS family permease
LLASVLMAVGVLSAGGFAVVERRASHPLVPPEARLSPLVRWGAFGSFFNTATTSSSFTVATLYLQNDLGLSPLRAAGLLVTFSILVVVGSLGAPRLIITLGWTRTLGCGLGVVAAGNAVLVALPHVTGVGVAAGICGLGLGVGSVAATDMGTAVGKGAKGTAAGVLNTAAQLGTAVGTASILLVATALEPRIAWAVVVVVAALAAVTADTARSSGPSPHVDDVDRRAAARVARKSSTGCAKPFNETVSSDSKSITSPVT